MNSADIRYCAKLAIGAMALGFMNLLAVVYDSQWLTLAVGIDVATVGVYLGVHLSAGDAK